MHPEWAKAPRTLPLRAVGSVAHPVRPCDPRDEAERGLARGAGPLPCRRGWRGDAKGFAAAALRKRLRLQGPPAGTGTAGPRRHRAGVRGGAAWTFPRAGSAPGPVLSRHGWPHHPLNATCAGAGSALRHRAAPRSRRRWKRRPGNKLSRAFVADLARGAQITGRKARAGSEAQTGCPDLTETTDAETICWRAPGVGAANGTPRSRTTSPALPRSAPSLRIGCSDSRVPANVVAGSRPGRGFRPSQLANIVHSSDMNLLSALEFAVD